MLALSSFITVLCVIYSWNHFPEPHNPKAFLALILLLETGMNGTFVAQDLILFFIFFELTLVPCYFIISQWGGAERGKAALKNCGYDFPPRRVTVNLAPADRRKEGPAFDLPIALGHLAYLEVIPAANVRETAQRPV